MHIFERLKEERERLGFTQTAFSVLGGCSLRAQANYESGKHSPDLNYLAAVEKVGVDVLYVITGKHAGASIAAEEEVLLKGFRKLDEATKDRALAMVYSGTPPGIKFNVQGNVGKQIDTVTGGTFITDMRSDKK